MQDFFITLLNLSGLAWWVEIKTDNPRCTYYFGPFSSAKECELYQSGYLEDLTGEGAQNIQVEIKRCKPTELTVEEDASFPSSTASAVMS